MSADARIRMVSVEEKPFASLRFRNAMGKGRVESCLLPAVRARVTGLPVGLGALVATSDLQGRTAVSRSPRKQTVSSSQAYTIPALDRRGVVVMTP